MNYTKRIITSVATLVLMVVALGTGAFAWFTINTKATASGLEGQIEAASGGFKLRLKNSTNGATDGWTESLDLSDIAGAGFKFTDLTTPNGIDFYKIGKSGKDKHVGGFITFDLEFLLADANTGVDAEVTITDGGETTFASDAANPTGLVLGTILKGNAASGARVAIVGGMANPVLFEAAEDKTDLNSGVVVGGEVNYKNTLGTTDNFALAYYNLVNASDIPVPTSGVLANTVGTTSGYTQVVNSDKLAPHGLGDLGAGFEGFTQLAKVTVSIWIEGWDAQTFNAILSGTVKVDFNFTATL